MTTPGSGGGELADELYGALVARGRVRAQLDDLLAVLIALRPDVATSSDRYRRLADVLGELTASGSIVPSVGQVRRGDVGLPRSVEMTGTSSRRSPRKANPALTHPWVPSMRWAAEIPRGSKLFRQLVQLNAWCAAHSTSDVVPVRERSLEIFGDDKELGRLLLGALAAPGRRPAELRVEVVHPPMAVERVAAATGGSMLVVENGTTFRSVLRAARRHAAGGVPVAVCWVGYGAGNQLASILPSVVALDPRPARLLYFGDLDPPGLTMAADAAAVCAAHGLPALEPHALLYRWLIEAGRPQQHANRAAWPRPGLDWLECDLATLVVDRLGTSHWLAQEWVGATMLAARPAWALG